MVVLLGFSSKLTIHRFRRFYGMQREKRTTTWNI